MNAKLLSRFGWCQEIVAAVTVEKRAQMACKLGKFVRCEVAEDRLGDRAHEATRGSIGEHVNTRKPTEYVRA
jgi:hypothetical protein